MLKIADIMGLPSLGQSYIVAGYDGIFNMIKKLDIMETPYPGIEAFLVPYEFMLTSFWSLKNDKENRINLVRAMIEHKCAGIGIMPGPNLGDTIDPEIIELGNDHSFPIIYIPTSARWSDIISEYNILSQSSMRSASDSHMVDILNAFSDLHSNQDLGKFSAEISSFISLPIILSVDSAYSSGVKSSTAALVLSKAHAIRQQNSHKISTPVSLRIRKDSLAIVYYGNQSIVATYIANNDINNPALHLFHEIAPIITRELDKLSSGYPYRTAIKNMEVPEDVSCFAVLIKKTNIQSLAKELNFKYLIYEENPFYNYAIMLIPNEYEHESDIYQEYYRLLELLKPDLFIFSHSCLYKKELLNEIKSLKFTINSLAFLNGVFSADELPLLYILSYAPYEYKSQLFQSLSIADDAKDEDRLFLDTLRLYIVLRNIGDVATLLGIHANSVKYRIAKCLKYFGYKDTNVLGDIPSVKLLILLEIMALDE